MEGPTPVSAMIHAAAMVSAGVYMIIRMFPLIGGTVPHGELVTFGPMIFIGTLTALFAATIAFTQRDVKKVLAIPISQLGLVAAWAWGLGRRLPLNYARLLQGALVQAPARSFTAWNTVCTSHDQHERAERAEQIRQWSRRSRPGSMALTGTTMLIRRA
jgi:NADH:ubiquinone oxidoreductase subunit 5 (subunit L)/multisubunit Na+/H+ antiporter MnhA subunit